MLVCPAFCAVVPAGSAISASGGAFAAGGPSRTGVEQEREEILHPRALVLAVGNFRPIAEKALSNAEDSCSDATRPPARARAFSLTLLEGDPTPLVRIVQKIEQAPSAYEKVIPIWKAIVPFRDCLEIE